MSAVKCCAPPWLLSVLLVKWIIVSLMDLGALRLNYRTTLAGDVPRARLTSDFLRGTWRGTWCAARRAARRAWAGIRANRRLLDKRLATVLVNTLATIVTLAWHARWQHVTLIGRRFSVQRASLYVLLRFAPIWILLPAVRCCFALRRVGRAATRSIRLLMGLPHRVWRARSYPLRTAVLFAVLWLCHGRHCWSRPLPDTPSVAPLARARADSAAAAEVKASATPRADQGVGFSEALLPPRRVGFALRSSSL